MAQPFPSDPPVSRRPARWFGSPPAALSQLGAFLGFPLKPQPLNRLVAVLPARSLAPLAAAVFCLFATMGFIVDLLAGVRHPPSLLISNVVFAGTIAVAYAYAFTRKLWVFPLALVLHFGYAILVSRLFSDLAPIEGPALRARLAVHGVGVMAAMLLSYTFFLRFISNTAAVYFKVDAEIALARQIHQVLVPSIDRRIGAYQFVGASLASGDVGGDLIDLVETPGGRWVAYVADVSGHGVAAGVLMGMTKSAARMRLRADASLASLLDELNTVLEDLKAPAMFVTLVCVSGERDRRGGGPSTLDATANGGEDLEFTVAGHLPILRVRPTGEVDEITLPQLAVGMFDGQTFRSDRLRCGAGETLALVTDGLTEVFDRHDREFGLEGVKGFLAAHARTPLPEIVERLIVRVRAHGAQVDDQTLLLIRRA